MVLPGRKINSLEELFEIFFTGVDKDYPEASVMMPKKKPRGKELTDGEKMQNKVISGIRLSFDVLLNRKCGQE